jgi:hypothetical protein
MTDALTNLLQPALLPTFLYPPQSRYHGIQTAMINDGSGRTVTYLLRRFVPDPDRFQEIKQHVVRDGQRLDIIAAMELGDPTLFWRLCDANRAIAPEELEVTGKRLSITLPERVGML